jgi:aconitate hydratase 2/2-methylisocitrate dehydratase
MQRGLLTLEKKGKKNVFSGRILEIEGLPNLKIEQAFELADASAERSAAACTVRLNKEPIEEYLRSNIVLLKWMIEQGYGDIRTLTRRIAAMEAWLADPVLLEPDPDAEYHDVIAIDLSEIKEPLLCCPNDPDDVKPLSAVAGTPVDEVFLGSCMTNIGHFRAAGKILENLGTPVPGRLWIAPPTRMDQLELTEEGYYGIYGKVGARTEIPGCSLCMGNQARVADNATVVSTSTRNFPNRMGAGANVFLASAELASVCSSLGRIPSPEEYMSSVKALEKDASDTYRYLNFDQIPDYVRKAEKVVLDATA